MTVTTSAGNKVTMYCLGSLTFVPSEAVKDEETHKQVLQRLAETNDFATAIRTWFHLADDVNVPEADEYVYHAIASVKLSQVQRAVDVGGAKGMHGWYKLEGGDLVCVTGHSTLSLFVYFHSHISPRLFQHTPCQHSTTVLLTLALPPAPSATTNRHRILHLHLPPFNSHGLGPRRLPVQRQTLLHPPAFRHLPALQAVPRLRLAPARQPAHHPQDQEGQQGCLAM